MKRNAIASDLKRVDALRDQDIDYSDIPKLDADFFRQARVVVPPGKQQLTIRLDTDVLAWLKARGKGYQSRINAILRAYYEAHRDEVR
ncbi:MAG: BrnA antitoxin family protein [Acidobacteria bacterium]|nr:BrnA antitoxin family protein [Acidobacteriota bacterium]